MKAEDALRFAAFQAEWCRSIDEHEALCLLFPSLLKVLDLRPMTAYEAELFRRDFREWLQRQVPPHLV